MAVGLTADPLLQNQNFRWVNGQLIETRNDGSQWISNPADPYGTPVGQYLAPPPTIAIPQINTGALQPLKPIQSPMGNSFMPAATPSPSGGIDPSLSTQSLLTQGQAALTAAQTPVDPTKFIAPGAVDLMTKGVNDQLNINRASAQSDFNRRGITGSSTEIQTLTKDLPAAANAALQEGAIKLLQAAYPLALADKQATVDAMFKTTSLSTQIRSMIGDENFKMLNLNQQRELANQDVQLKLTLADLDMKFQAQMKQAEFAFTAAENDKDRAIAEKEYQYLVSERKKAREGAFMKSLTTLAGFGIGLAMAPATAGASTLMMYGGLGAMGGGAAGDAFGGLFTMD